MAQAEYNLYLFKYPELRRYIESALEYQRRIDRQINQKERASMLWDTPEDIANQVNDWISNMYQLALRLDAYRQDTLIHLELEQVPKDLQTLKLQRQKEQNPVFQQELDHVIDSKTKQLETLQALETRMRQAQFQLEQSLAALGTMDGQVQLIDAQDVSSGRSERMRQDIKDQINRLNDLVSSINEVYSTKGA